MLVIIKVSSATLVKMNNNE